MTNCKLPKFLEAMKLVLADERSVILTDLELRIAVNHKLEPKDRVGLRTFEYWKSPTLTAKSPENFEGLDAEIVEEFREILAYARVEQKMNLTGNLMDANNKAQWGSTWILERKFDDLKVNKGNQEINQPIIQITTTNDNHKELIQNILNGNNIRLQPYKEEVTNYSETEFTDITGESINPLIDNE